MNSTIALTMTCAMLLAGACTSLHDVRPYKAPTDPNAARLQIRSVRLTGYAFLNIFENAQDCRYPHEITGIRKVLENQEIKASTTLRGDQPETLWFNTFSVASDLTCRVMLTFEPRSGRNYLITLQDDRDTCMASLSDITDPVMPVPVKRWFPRKVRSTMDITGSHCRSADIQAELAAAEKKSQSVISLDDLSDILPPQPDKAKRQ